MAKKYDPLWEIIDEKIPLQGQVPDIDARCPFCHVTIHLGLEAQAGDKLTCGLCGESLKVVSGPQGPAVESDVETE